MADDIIAPLMVVFVIVGPFVIIALTVAICERIIHGPRGVRAPEETREP